MSQELSYKHPDGWVITTQNFSEGQTEINSPTKTEPSGWVNVPNIDPYQGLVKVEQLDVNSLSAITANMGSITSGTITIDSEGYIKGGQTAYNTGTGFFLGYDGSAYKFSIGGATNNLKWDGTNMIINGSTVNAVNFELNGTGVTANANELNLLDGVVRLRPIITSLTAFGYGNTFRMCANDSYIFNSAGPTTSGTIYAMQINSDNSLQPIQTSSTVSSWINSTAYDYKGGLGCNSTYIYTWAQNVATTGYVLLRITISDKTETEMTISGTAPDADANNSVTMDSAGVLYIGDINGTTVRKYTISGTTATYSSAVTVSNTIMNSQECRLSVGKNGDLLYRSSSAPTKLIRDDSTGSNQGIIIETTRSKFGGVFISNNDWYWSWSINDSFGDYFFPTIYSWQ